MRLLQLSKLVVFSFVFSLIYGFNVASTQADPCGMVPPIYTGQGPPITRIGVQKTYVSFKDGIETFVIRPGFSGKVEQFGMLIPFPTPPAIRKVPDHIFPHIAKAIDPPEVVVDLRPEPEEYLSSESANRTKSEGKGSALKIYQVRVLKQEAVGMYEVAVLQAGSSKALNRWMEDHGFQYPKGMDEVCEDYIKSKWCFVAVKAKVGEKRGVTPKPGQRKVKANLPQGASFDGNVQAMGFRFKSDKFVVPMRLSAFNPGSLRNIVYIVTDGPSRIRSIPEEYVVRQIPGADLFRNVTGPLPLRIIGGSVADIPEYRRKQLKTQRDPNSHNGAAKELFATDLRAIRSGKLSLEYEETEKALLAIGESMGLRGKEIDALHAKALTLEREKTILDSLSELKNMTLTVIDGDFPREVIAKQNLAFGKYRMPARRNKTESYDAKKMKPGGKQEGILKLGYLEKTSQHQQQKQETLLGANPVILSLFGLAVLFGAVFYYRHSRCH